MSLAKLDQRRSKFAGRDVGKTITTGKCLVWADYRKAEPTLHGFVPTTEQRLGYGSAASVSGGAVFRASDEIIATVEFGGGMLHCHAYDASQANRELGQLSLDAPSGGIKWYAFAVDKGAVYLVREGTKTELIRWIPGGAMTPVLTFEEIGLGVAIFEDFAVQGSVLLLVESGRLWHVDLAKRTATWVRNETEVSGTVSFDAHTVLYQSASGPFWYDIGAGTTFDVAAAIDENPWKLNDTFANAHHYAGSATLVGDSVLYHGQTGKDETEPVVLEPHDFEGRLDYANPIGVGPRDVFVVGLESESGAVGAEGPFYRVRW